MPVNIKLFEDLDAVEAEAGGALDRKAQRSLFDRMSWFRRVAEHKPGAGTPLVACVARGEQKSWLFLSVSSDKARSLTLWYSLRFGLVGAPDGAEAIAATLKKRVGVVELSPVVEPGALADAFRAAGWIVRVAPVTVSWRCGTAGQDFTAYWAQRPSRLRNTATRKARAAGLEIEIHRDFDPAAWADYEAVYAASWKGEEGSPQFLRALAEEEGAAGALRLGIAKKNGRPVAAQLWTVENGTAWIHKLAYDEEAKALSPGTVLSMEMFRHALDEDRVERIDYGTGDDAYKRDWMEERATLWRIEAYNPRRLSGLSGALRAGAGALVRRLRRR